MHSIASAREPCLQFIVFCCLWLKTIYERERANVVHATRRVSFYLEKTWSIQNTDPNLGGIINFGGLFQRSSWMIVLGPVVRLVL